MENGRDGMEGLMVSATSVYVPPAIGTFTGSGGWLNGETEWGEGE